MERALKGTKRRKTPGNRTIIDLIMNAGEIATPNLSNFFQRMPRQWQNSEGLEKYNDYFDT